MKWNLEHEWENFLRKKVEEFEVKYEEKYWQEALASLKSHDERKRFAWSKYKWIIGSIAGIFITISSVLGIYWYSSGLKGSASAHNKSSQANRHATYPQSPQAIRFSNSTLTHFAPTNQKLASLRLASKSQKEYKNFVKKPKHSTNFNLQSKVNYDALKEQRRQDAEQLIEQERARAVLTRWWLYYWHSWVAPEFVSPFKEPVVIELLKLRNLYAFIDTVQMDKKFEKWSSSQQAKKWLGKPVQVYGGVGSEMIADKNDNYSFLHVGHVTLQFVVHPRWVLQSAARLAYGKSVLAPSPSKSSLNLQIPIEIGYRWGRHSLLAGMKAEQLLLGESTIKQKAFASMMFQSYYKQFMLRTGFYLPLNPNYQERWRYEVSFSVKLF